MITSNLYLLPSPSCNEEAIQEQNITKVFAVKSPLYREWLEEKYPHIEFCEFENIECHEPENPLDPPTEQQLNWIQTNMEKGENVGVMCANGFQRSIPVLSFYADSRLGMPIEDVLGKVKECYPNEMRDIKTYEQFIRRLGWF